MVDTPKVEGEVEKPEGEIEKVEEKKVELNADDAFSAAFSEASAPEPVKKVEVDPKPIVEKKVEPEVEVEAKTDDKVEPEKKIEPEKKADDGVDEVLSRLAKIVKDQPEKAVEKKAEPEKAAELYSPEEQEILSTYAKDWPDVQKAEALARRGEYQHLLGYVFREFAKEFQPLVQLVDQLAARNQLGELKASVPDYSPELVESVTGWVKKQPSYLQEAYNRVITEGTAEEALDLINRFRADTGVGKPVPKVVAKKEAELPPGTKQAAAALAPVSSKRSAISQTLDPEDFSSAFAEFAKSV